jgi:hypothetical protein
MSDPILKSEPVDELREERERRERGLEPKARIEIDNASLVPSVLVVLEDGGGGYHCHRYIKRFGEGYDCSFDAQSVDINTVFEWLNDPRALR